MTRPLSLNLGLTLTVLALVACDETSTPMEAGTAAEQPLATPSLAFPNTWLAVAPMPAEFHSAAHPTGLWRFDLAAGVVRTATGGSTVYVIGGRFEQTPTDMPATRVLAWDVGTISWTKKAARFTGAATNGIGQIGGNLYISGGANFSGQTEQWTDKSARLFAYDVAGDRMIRKADMPHRTAEGVTGVMNGKLYVLAGRCQEDFCRRFYRYDPATNAWATLPPAPNSHRRGAGAVLNGKFYVAGGGSFPFQSFDVYDPVKNAWRTLGVIPRRRQFAVGAAVGGSFYVIGIAGADRGAGSQVTDRTTLAYDPASNTWSDKTPFPGPVGEGGQFLLRPAAAVRVVFEGIPSILTVGSGHLYTDDTVKPAGTIDPTVSYIFTP